jgi:hypothetical protein
MRGEKFHEGIEIQRRDRPFGAPILKRVPRLRSIQDDGGTVGVFEVMWVAGNRQFAGDRLGRSRRVRDGENSYQQERNTMHGDDCLQRD